MHPRARQWWSARTFPGGRWAYPDLVAAKAASGVSVAVVLPALDEQDTVGAIVGAVRSDLPALVDDLVVLDSGSTDATARLAAAAGARVVAREDVFPDVPVVPGKGEAMWRAVAATTADIVVFIDADLHSFRPDYVTGLLGPLLDDPTTMLVKAMYERPLVDDDGAHRVGAGGRVTELVARPLLNLHWPTLAGLAQPLAGEYAARREFLERVPFACGYGVDLGLVLDAASIYGLDAIAQVDLGVRVHRHHDELRLGRMAAEIWQAALDRLDPEGRLRRASGGLGTTLTQFASVDGAMGPVTYDVGALSRPPLMTMDDYVASRSMPSRRADRAR
jgi:glucosyl-3-phosphoglycerate synthase